MNNLQANLCLLAVTLCWSCEVAIYSVIPDGVNPFAAPFMVLMQEELGFKSCA